MPDTDEDSRTIFCGNLSDQVTEELLFELFLQGGPLDRVHIPKDKDGRQRTFGFITYTHSQSVPYALQLFYGTKLFNRELSMNPRNSNGSNANSNSSHNVRSGLSSSLPSTYGSNLFALCNPTAGHPFRDTILTSPPSSLIHGPSIPRHLAHMQPSPLNNRGRGNRNEQSNRNDIKTPDININYLLKAAPHLLQRKNIDKTIDDLELLKNAGRSINDSQSKSQSNTNSSSSNSSSSNYKHLNRNDNKSSSRNDRPYNNDRDRHGRRGNSPGQSSRGGGGGYDRKYDDRQHHNRNNGRRR